MKSAVMAHPGDLREALIAGSSELPDYSWMLCFMALLATGRKPKTINKCREARWQSMPAVHANVILTALRYAPP